MKKRISKLLVVLLMPLIFCSLAEAKRGPAPKVEPVISGEIKIIAPNTPQRMGYIEIWNWEKKEIIWEKKVYDVFINPIMESDVQWNFISAIINNGDEKLIVFDEDNKQYNVTIPKEIAETLKKNYLLRKSSYDEEWVESSIEENEGPVKKAKEALEEWGQNSEKYEFESKFYDYEIRVFESENFISVTFYPLGLDVTSQEVEIRMTKDGLIILSILQGS